MMLTDYVEAAFISEAVKQTKYLEQTFVDKASILANIRWLVGIDISTDVLEHVLARALEGGAAELIHDEMAGEFYRFTYPKLSQLNQLGSENTNSLIYKYNVIGRKFLENAASKFGESEINLGRPILEQPSVQIPASDRIVRLDDNSDLRDEIIGKIDEIANVIRGHNDDDGKLTERERILAELRASEELLKGPSVRVVALSAVLGTALAWLAKEFAGGIIGQLAVILIELLGPLLGL
ncbi:hypothetical protein EUU23_03215 [Sphingorhabdus sp. IMCC26285]|uniref:Uncharacterized protein n=1 Tax=Sphingorhabdus profundilacus TaxID=2509718 RepID=A0A6I4M328_9SPHN|nr:hypothetical protein [Sphingorhabdus profundilacus]MVZ96715.1 hypothetical protein [Sphingorhabdus profundilacus]